MGSMMHWRDKKFPAAKTFVPVQEGDLVFFTISIYNRGEFRGDKNMEVFREVVGEYFLIKSLDFDLVTERSLGELLEML
jgi:hypothetical protein